MLLIIKIIKGFKGEGNAEDVDPLVAIINGGEDYVSDGE